MFCNDGKQYQVVLPCAMDRLWPLPMGIMMERSKISNPVTHSTTTLSPANDSSALMDDGIPTIFSLLHPLEEVKPVSFLSHAELLGRLPVPPIVRITNKKHHFRAANNFFRINPRILSLLRSFLRTCSYVSHI